MGTAAIGIPAVLAVNIYGRWLFAVVLAAAGIVAALELHKMARVTGARPVATLAIPVSAAMAAMPLYITKPQGAWIGCIAGVVAAAGSFVLLPGRHERGLMSWLFTFLPVVYIGLFLGHIGLLRQARDGGGWVLTVLIVTWAYDTGAYTCGRLWGRHPFMSHVSPTKTWEGVLGGTLVAGAGGLVALPAVGLAPWQAILFGTIGGLVAQAGDLVESMIKRHTGVKDSGAIVPGHGGLLDRIDSLLFVGVLGYYCAVLFGYAA